MERIYGLNHENNDHVTARIYGHVSMKPKLDEKFLEHFGVLGMRWGRRKGSDSSSKGKPTYEPTVDPIALGSPIKNMDKTIHTSTQNAAHEVAAMLKSRYGYEVTSVVAIEDKRKFKNYLAYVEGNAAGGNAKSKGTIHVQPRDLNPQLKKAEDSGWFGAGAGNVRSVMTHETAHSMFHAEEVYRRGKVTGGSYDARQKALEAAKKTANTDGVKTRDLAKNISGYARASMWVEESEAEMFSQYHWSPNPPKFIKVWGETLHKEMGIDPTPFREVIDI